MDLTLRPQWVFEISHRVQVWVPPEDPGTVPWPCGSAADARLRPQSAFETKAEAVLRARADQERARVRARLAQDTRVHDVLHVVAPLGDDRLALAVRRAVDVLAEEPARKWTLEALARRVGCNRTDLEKGFHQHLRCSYREFLNRARVRAAQALLATTAWRVEEVGKASGFASKASFYFNFKALQRLHAGGIPPTLATGSGHAGHASAAESEPGLSDVNRSCLVSAGLPR